VATIDPTLSAIVALGLALLFASSAVHKLADWPKFCAALTDYRLSPAWMSPALACAVVALELTAAVLLPPVASRPPAALVAAGLLCAYAGAIGLNLRRGRTRLDCGCLGAGARKTIGSWMVVRNLLLAGLALIAALPVSDRPLATVDALSIGAAVACLAILYGAIDVLQQVATGPASRSSP
jgi:hypothetical protein